ncbi:hypothetical protein CI610_00043 [invertebrate metagenome]|uniref:Major facilitator superfamily (MFS) profile domain-containing protein n=1 Tax=invertebrate metagenome TaxID=1711999 RepID=A0A2H9TCL3_9ZZZZ
MTCKPKKHSFLRQSPENLLLVMAFVMPMTFSVWQALLNNFVIEQAHFTGQEIGILQSLREIPGFLAFTAIFLLLLFTEQTIAYVSLIIMSIGVAVTGFWPTAVSLYLTTILMSVGFHYFETINQSLTLQWLPKDKTAGFMGKVLAVRGFSALLAYGSIWLLMEIAQISYQSMYLIAGCTGIIIVLSIGIIFPRFPQKTAQNKTLVLRKRYCLYYLLTFLSGARRQIFIVFAGFMMVEKFHYSVGEISLLFLINYAFNMIFAPAIGRWISRIGEKRTLIIEYTGLIIIFTGYAFTEQAYIAAILYVLDHLFFALAIAIKTYFQKIADPKDIAASSGVSFTINHIAAVIIPALLGLIWVHSNTFVFITGSFFAFCSLLLACMIPKHPDRGNETIYRRTTRIIPIKHLYSKKTVNRPQKKNG